jgi:hypothetical protein
MTGNLEYLMASLPNLSFEDAETDHARILHVLHKYAGSKDGEQDPITILEEEAAKFLPESDARLFRKINLNHLHKQDEAWAQHTALEAFGQFMQGLKQDIKRLRQARRAGPDAGKAKGLILPIDPGDPLEEELFLLGLQWAKLDEFSFGRYADFGALILYKLKLLVLARRWTFDQEKGLETFMAITKTTEYGG